MVAQVYVNSVAGSNTSPFDTWAKGATSLAGALAVALAGDNVWVASDHVDNTGAAITLTSPGTAASPCFLYCVNRAGSVPPVSADLTTGAIVSPNLAGNLTVTFAGFAYCQGITFKTGSGVNAPSINILTGGVAGWWNFKNCAMIKLGTTSGPICILGTVTTSIRNKIVFDNTTIQAGNVGDGLNLRACDFTWKNTASAITGATVPTTLIIAASSAGGTLLRGVDLSALASGATLVSALNVSRKIILEDCRLGASVTVAATPTDQGGGETTTVRADSSGTKYRHEKYQYMGTQTVETTIVRTGGATDGTTPIAWKIVTTANSSWVLPFESLPISIWNASTGSVTVTVYGIWGGGAVPNNDDIWIEAEYLGSAATPMGSFATATKADNLATGSALATDTSTWGGSTTKFKMTATFTPGMAGPINIAVKAAKLSSTFYVDPKPVLS